MIAPGAAAVRGGRARRGHAARSGSRSGAFAVGAVLLRPYAGRLGDRYGRRILVIVGAFVVAVSARAVPARVEPRLPRGGAGAGRPRRGGVLRRCRDDDRRPRAGRTARRSDLLLVGRGVQRPRVRSRPRRGGARRGGLRRGLDRLGGARARGRACSRCFARDAHRRGARRDHRPRRTPTAAEPPRARARDRAVPRAVRSRRLHRARPALRRGHRPRRLAARVPPLRLPHPRGADRGRQAARPARLAPGRVARADRWCARASR